MIGRRRFSLLILLYGPLLTSAQEDTEQRSRIAEQGSRIRVTGPLQNAVRNAYRNSARFRTIYDRLKKEPRLELVIGPHGRRRNQYSSDKTVVRIVYDQTGGIRRLIARVQINSHGGPTRTQRIGHELAHLEEILDRQMAPSKMARIYPHLAFQISGWLAHYETHYAIEAELEIAEQNQNVGDNLSVDQLERLEKTLFQSIKVSQREVQRRAKYYKKLRKKEVAR